MFIVVRWLYVFLYVLLLFIFSAQPESSAGTMSQGMMSWFPNLSKSDIQTLVFYVRKLGHVLAYAFGTAIIVYALHATPRLRKNYLAWGFTFALIIACLDEWYQSTLPHRTGSIVDVFIDMIGITFAIAVIGWRHYCRVQRNKNQGYDKELQENNK